MRHQERRDQERIHLSLVEVASRCTHPFDLCRFSAGGGRPGKPRGRHTYGYMSGTKITEPLGPFDEQHCEELER
jgi:hypothetical protein